MGERDRLGTAALAAAGGLVLVVAGVGAVGVLAEWSGVWGSYFLMERAVGAAAPVATVLAGATLLLGTVLALRS